MNNTPRRKRRNPRRTFFAVLLTVVTVLLCAAVLFGIFMLVRKIGFHVSLNDKDKQTDDETRLLPEDGNTEDTLPNEPDPIPEPVYRHASFAAAGDVLVHTNVYKYASQLAQGTDKEFDFKPIFANVKEIISSADFSYVNQETICGGKELGYSGYPTFNTPDEIAEALIDTGFDIVNIANNHMLDKGERGLSRGIDFWNEQPVTLIGGFKNKEDYENIRVYEVNGIKVAFLAYTDWTNGLVLPASSELVVPYANKEEIDRQTKAARNMADLVFVSMHWGVEDSFLPTDGQKELAAVMAQNNVDVVLGMHPHVLEPIEWIDRPDGKQMLCAYSFGNFISTMMYSRNMLGGILRFDINEDENGFSIDNVELIPTMVHYSSGFASPTIYLFKDYTQDMQLTHGSRKYDNPPKDISYLNGILTKYIPKEFIKEPSLAALYDEAA